MSNQEQTQAQVHSDVLEATYNFRKNKETGHKRATVEVKIPAPTANEIIAILEDDSDANKKTRALVLEQIYQPIIAAVRSRVDANEDFDQAFFDTLPKSDFSLHTLANLPRSERSTTTKEELEAFADSYVAVMVEAGKISAKAGDQAKVLIVGRFKQVAGDTAVLSKMQTRLNEYMELVDDATAMEHEKAVTTLITKLDDALSADFNADAL